MGAIGGGGETLQWCMAWMVVRVADVTMSGDEVANLWECGWAGEQKRTMRQGVLPWLREHGLG